MSKLKTVSYMLDEDVEKWIKEEARQRERSASWLVRLIIDDYRDRLKQRQEPLTHLPPSLLSKEPSS